MPATNYRVWGWGSTVLPGNNRASHCSVGGVGKAASAGSPYELINELICGDLGRALLLPIPPGIMTTRKSELHYVSLDFSEAGQRLPPANARMIADNHPELACGVILFDLWIANADRHNDNLSYDEPTKSLQLFDHGYALLGTDGCNRFATLDDADIIDSNCLTAEISAMAGFDKWTDRIKSIPKFFIDEVVTDAVKIGLDKDDAKKCIEFLLNRRSRLLRLVKKHKAQFFNVKPLLPGLGTGTE